MARCFGGTIGRQRVNNDLPHCDIVIPVFNGLTYVTDCIDSIFKNTNTSLCHIYIIDDGSDFFTHEFLGGTDLDAEG